MNKKIEKLANEILENSGTHREYSDMDLSNATIIFTEVMMAKSWDKHAKKINTAGMIMWIYLIKNKLKRNIK